ncbi:hypothetical protein AFV8_gp42 [Betalipothrixvirus puteoliense]|uniref:Uncharacterized protein n=1 Tax=Betalipothrixvirus puteoliense TaxID=346884 RepID=A7WKX2_9VIRU|nr:hypothetical protein AFV8_gp42 [Acidianus filamentous virus 8]CAJ31719.1 conserved hypothetical protein [Acidianus filamentous virus 8]
MAEAVAFLAGSSGGGIVSALEDIGNQILEWLRKMFMTIWRHIVGLFYRMIDYFMKDPVGFITMVGELIVFLV